MRTVLLPCERCARHVGADDAVCPFCQTRRTGVSIAGVAVIALSMAVVACDRVPVPPTPEPSDTTRRAAPVYGGPPVQNTVPPTPTVPEAGTPPDASRK